LQQGHCCQIAENSEKKLKYSGRKKLFTERNWRRTLAEIAEEKRYKFIKYIRPNYVHSRKKVSYPQLKGGCRQYCM
jgi:hypothetical protein